MPAEGNIKEVLQPILRVLRDLGGKFVFTDDEGNAFVIMSKGEASEEDKEQQLSLPAASAVEAAVRQHAPDISDDIIDAINRDIALSQEDSLDQGDDLALPQIPAPKLRFEPLRGDLPPDLQE